MNAIAQIQPAQALDTRYTQDVIPILDTGKFEHMQRIAIAMAEGSTIPDSLRREKRDGKDVDLPRSVVVANCFRVVNQAVRWGFDPFAVMDCVSLVHGRMMYEGKLIHAVISAKLGVDLGYEFFDEQKGDGFGVVVSGTLPRETKVRTIEGRVRDWHKGTKSPWANSGDWKRQLRYRGAREWARAHAPAILLGVYSDDELNEIAQRDVPSGQRALRFKDVTPQPAIAALPDIPDVATDPDPSDDDTQGARDMIAASVNVAMLEHVRQCYPDADWEHIAHEYDAKLAKLQEVSAK